LARIAHDPGHLAGDVDPGRLAEAEPGPHLVEARRRRPGALAETERHLRGDHVAGVGDAVLERHPAHPLAIGVVDLGPAAVELERPGVLDPGGRGDRAGLQRRRSGHHLEHRSGLVDARDEGVDEP
jgi:hypothetical protein